MFYYLYIRSNTVTRRITMVDGACVAYHCANTHNSCGGVKAEEDLSYLTEWKGPDKVMRDEIKKHNLLCHLISEV